VVVESKRDVHTIYIGKEEKNDDSKYDKLPRKTSF